MMYVYLLIAIISFCCAVMIYLFIEQIEELKKRIDELKKDIEDTMKYMTDMEIRFERLQKETKENRNGNN